MELFLVWLDSQENRKSLHRYAAFEEKTSLRVLLCAVTRCTPVQSVECSLIPTLGSIHLAFTRHTTTAINVLKHKQPKSIQSQIQGGGRAENPGDWMYKMHQQNRASPGTRPLKQDPEQEKMHMVP